MRIPKRRRIEGKTDYAHRVRMLKGETPRVVFRRTNRYVIAEYITSHESQDKVEIGLTSKNLKKYGWPEEFDGSLKSVTATYLTGYLMGKEIAKKKLATPIVDVGMVRTLSKNKVFAFINGLVDSGLKIKCSKEKFPEAERIEGKSMKKDFSKTFKEIKLKLEKI